MPRSTYPTRLDPLAWHRELLTAIGQHRRAECELQEELAPKLTALLTQKVRDNDPYRRDLLIQSDGPEVWMEADSVPAPAFCH